jgi:hypothetical protein
MARYPLMMAAQAYCKKTSGQTVIPAKAGMTT